MSQAQTTLQNAFVFCTLQRETKGWNMKAWVVWTSKRENIVFFITIWEFKIFWPTNKFNTLSVSYLYYMYTCAFVFKIFANLMCDVLLILSYIDLISLCIADVYIDRDRCIEACLPPLRRETNKYRWMKQPTLRKTSLHFWVFMLTGPYLRTLTCVPNLNLPRSTFNWIKI